MNSPPQMKTYDWHIDGKVKLVDLNQHEFEYRGLSRPIALRGISGSSRFH